jgi:hypothetical protein
MALEYVKLANVTALVASGDLARPVLLAAVTAGETKVVTLKGRILTAAEVARHLDGTLDGETVVRT